MQAPSHWVVSIKITVMQCTLVLNVHNMYLNKVLLLMHLSVKFIIYNKNL